MPRDGSLPASVAPASFTWTAAAPAVFALLWSTGFVAAMLWLTLVPPATALTAVGVFLVQWG